MEKLESFNGAAIDAGTLAGLLGVSPKSIYKLSKRGELPAFKVGNCLRFCPAKVAGWLERQ